MTPSGGRRRWRHSLGARLILLFVVLALAMTVTFVAGMQTALRHGWADFARPLISDYVDTLVAEIGTPPDVAKAEALTRRLPLRIRIEGPVVNWASHPREGDRGRPRHHEAGTDGNAWRPSRLLADGHRVSFGLASLPRDDEDSPEDRPRRIGWMTLAALLMFTALAYVIVRHWLRPLRDIRAGAIRYGRGDFSTPIPKRGHDELGELAAQINAMAASLRHMLDAKRQLLLAISHELRSPLTRARLNAELIDDGPERDALLGDLSEIRDLITDLLESERLAAGHAALHTEPTRIGELVAEVVADRAIDVALDPDLPARRLDRPRIKLLLRNLIDNALRHTPAGAPPPRLSASEDAGTLVLRMRDHGPGVPEDTLAQLGEAFYRPDTARQRATGGVGLGLHLCRLVATAHGGEMTIRNASPGLEITVRLPVPPIT